MDTNTTHGENTTKRDDTLIVTRHGTVRVTIQPETDGE